MKVQINLLYFILGLSFLPNLNAQKYISHKGEISFTSSAPLENIKAKTKAINGIIDFEKNEFAISVDVKKFNGFNSPLQKEHFHENYLESNLFPKATFSGKIIEKVSLESNSTFTIRAKGLLDIHGVKNERIIKIDVKVIDNKVFIKSNFDVLLVDHNIKIPKIVNQKIAEKIIVSVEMVFEKQ